MKDGFRSIIIEPFNGYLDFQGPINPQETSGKITLKGDIRLELIKTVKVKSITVKFKGNSRVCHQNAIEMVDISTPILPKLESQLLSSTTNLGPGEVTFPWAIQIPNLFPSSVMIKRLRISYKIELTISMGLNRTVKAEYPIILKRHLLPCLQVAPLVTPKLYTKTISTKFHYEINAPRIVCVAQETIPMVIKLLTIGAQKRVLSIRTQLLQVELYRCSGLPKTDADMTKFKTHSLGQKGTRSVPGKRTENNKYAKYTKRTAPAIIHTLDETIPMPTNQPLLVRHPLGEYLNIGLESPLAAIYHQLEITFQFGSKFEDIRAKIPIVIASAGPDQLTISQNSRNQQRQPIPTALYPFEKISVVKPISVTNECQLDRYTPIISTSTTTSTSNSTDATTMEEEEGDEIIKIVDDFPCNDNNSEDPATAELSNNIDSLQLDSYSLQHARSAVHLKASPMITKGKFDNQPLKTMKQPDSQKHHPTNALSPLSPPISNNLALVLPATEHSPPHVESKRLLSNSMEKMHGILPGPGTQIPYQWHQRNSGQSYRNTNPMISSISAIDPKQHETNLNIISPSVNTPQPSVQLHTTSSKDDSLASATTKNDDSSIIDASKSSASSVSSVSSIAVAESINISNMSSPYAYQSRSSSPTFSVAPGLQSCIPLHPQEPTSVALLEESPSSMTSTLAHSFLPLSPTQCQLHDTSLQNTHNNNHDRPSRTSLTLNIQSSNENMARKMQATEIQYRHQMEQQQSSEQHYTYAKLPPIPTTSNTLDLRKGHCQTTICYVDDSSSDNDDGMYISNDSDDAVFPPPIAISPPLAQENNDDRDGLICLCPKHGIVVTRR